MLDSGLLCFFFFFGDDEIDVLDQLVETIFAWMMWLDEILMLDLVEDDTTDLDKTERMDVSEPGETIDGWLIEIDDTGWAVGGVGHCTGMMLWCSFHSCGSLAQLS